MEERRGVKDGIYKWSLDDYEKNGTDLVDMGRYRIRALNTQLVEKMIKGEKGPDTIFPPEAMNAAWVKGDLEAGVLPAGQVAGLISSVLSAREVIEEMQGSK